VTVPPSSEPSPRGSLFAPPPQCCKLLVNHRAGWNKHHPTQRAALAAAFAPVGEVAMVEARAGLTALLHRWKAEGVDVLALSGGDGTMQRALEAMLAIWGDAPLPHLLFLDGGTAGLVPRSAGTGRALTAVAGLREAVQRRAPVPVRPFPTLRIGDHRAFTVGLGAFHRMAVEYVARGRRGQRDHARMGVGLFGSWLVGGPFARRMFEPLPYPIHVGDRRFATGELFGLHVSSLDRFMLGIYRRLDLRADGLRLVALGPLTRRQLLAGMVPLGLGALPLPSPMLVTNTEAVTLESEGPIPYMADGEFFTSEGPLRIERGVTLSAVMPWTDGRRR
jgi:diacylglycerol kinase (ATP)